MAGLRQLGNASNYWQEYDFLEFCDAEVAFSSPVRESTEVSDGLAALARTIETEIVPRLMLAHKADISRIQPEAEQEVEPSKDDVVGFAETVINGDMKAALLAIEGLRARGVSLESIYIDLMAPAARYLGELWLEDRCDFMAVTLGLSRMQQLLSALSTASEPGMAAADLSRRALLATVPGEQHTFGLYMVAEFFRRSGWDVWGGVPEDADSVLELVMDDWFDVIGLSVSREGSLSQLDQLIRGVRKCSRNSQIGVLLGGRAFDGREHLAHEFGAHAVITNGRQAVIQAQEIVSNSNRRLS